MIEPEYDPNPYSKLPLEVRSCIDQLVEANKRLHPNEERVGDLQWGLADEALRKGGTSEEMIHYLKYMRPKEAEFIKKANQ